MNIKLAAIAKDEAAYLPEWVFHHLYFGFDEIEVFVNFTTDGSSEVLEKYNQTIRSNFATLMTLLFQKTTHMII